MNFTLITGASQGIGKALAEAFAREGNHLILTARSSQVLEELANSLSSRYKITVHTYAVDLLEKDAVENLYEWCASKKYIVRILINNAGVGHYGKFEEVPLESYQDMIFLNQSVLVAMCYTFLPMLSEIRNAHILNVSSVAAYEAIPYLSVYAGTKSFVLMFSKALRQELIHTSINISCICPGPTDTAFYTNAGFGNKVEDFKNMQMDPGSVAEIALDGLSRKQAVIVPGFTNKIGTFFIKFIPSGMVAELIAFVLKPRKKFKK